MGDYCVVVKRGHVAFSFGDFCGLRPIFAYEKEGMIGISNRQVGCYRKFSISSPQPVFNSRVMRVDDGSGKRLRRESHVPGRPPRCSEPPHQRSKNRNFAFWRIPPASIPQPRNLTNCSRDDVDTATNAAVDQARLLAELPISELQMDLTGGMDSRACPRRRCSSSGLISKVNDSQDLRPTAPS